MTDWRLPTISELQNSYNYETGTHKVAGFKRGYYWSSSFYPNEKSLIYVMCFDKGWTTLPVHDDVRKNKRNELKFYVRCVRENNGELEWSKATPKAVNYQEALEWCETLESGIYKKI